MAKLVKGVMIPDGVARNAAGKVLNARSKRREEPLVFSKLDGLLTKRNPRICIYRRLGGIGDVIMTTPLLKHIKRVMPGCHLVYATDLTYSNGALADVIHGNPFVDELISYQQATARDFDFFSDVTATGLSRERSGTIPPNRIDMFAEQIGLDISSDPLPTYIVPDDEQKWAKNLIEPWCAPYKRSEITLIGIQIKSNDNRRTWPLEHNQELIRLLTQDPKVRIASFYWEEHNFIKHPQVFNCNYTFRTTAAIVQECDVVITPDSAILHLAGALQKKTVSIFGPIPPESRINHYPNTIALVAGMPCQYCWYNPTCGNKITCMREVTPQMAYNATMNKLAEETKVQKVISHHSMKGFKPDNVVLVKRHFGGFGDIIMAMTAVEALSIKYPSKDIYLAIPKKFWPAAENSPVVKKLLDADKDIRNNHYSIVMDISTPCAHYEASRVAQRKKVDKSRVEIFSEALGVSGIAKKKVGTYYISDEEKAWAQEFLPKTDKPRLGIAISCAEEYREWPKDKYVKLIPLLTDKFQVVIIDTTREFEFKDVVDGCGFPFRKAAALVGECDLILTPDTSILHVAAALGKKVVALFGPIDPQARCKGHPRTRVLTSNTDCMPCWRNQNMKCKKTGSARGYSQCMLDISVKDVYETLITIKESK